jgi:hypothetical protein
MNFKNFFLRAVLALSILAAAPAALAGPIYRVTLNTGWAGQSGFLDLSFGGLVGAGSSVARVTGFQGDFDTTVDPYFEPDDGSGQGSERANGSRAGGFTLVAGDTLALVSQAVTFGDSFSFDLQFDVAAAGLASDFGIGLLDENLNPLTWGDTALTFTITPGGGVTFVGAELASVQIVNDVPEPSDWALVLTGLVLIGSMRRLQSRR